MSQSTDNEHPEWVSQAYRESDKVQPDNALDDAVLAMAKKQATDNGAQANLPIKSKPDSGIRFWLIRGSLVASVALLSVIWVIQRPVPILGPSPGPSPKQQMTPQTVIDEAAPVAMAPSVKSTASIADTVQPSQVAKRSRSVEAMSEAESVMRPMMMAEDGSQDSTVNDALLEELLELKAALPTTQKAFEQAQRQLFNRLMQQRSLAQRQQKSWELDEKYVDVLTEKMLIALGEAPNN